MLLFPHCKINIGLYVTGKRPDGYHNLETLFYPVLTMTDVLEAVPAETDSLTVTGAAVAGDREQNLVSKACQLLRQRYPGKVPPLDMHLHKLLPMGAGLGGGSADGAFMLKLVNELCGLGAPESELLELALLLGSDCPFFIRETPQYARGRGEEMEPVALDLSGYEIRIESPGIHVSTAAAFAMLQPRPAPFDLRELPSVPVAEWQGLIGNDFEAPVFAKHPEIAVLKERLYADGALYAQMSGSGSAVFGIFERR